MKKRLIAGLLSFALTTGSLGACSLFGDGLLGTEQTDQIESDTDWETQFEETEEETEPETKEPGEYHEVAIDIVGKSDAASFWKAVRKGAKKAQAELEIPWVNVIIPDEELNTGQLLAMKDSYENQVNFICVAPGYSEDLIDMLDTLKRNNIAFLNIGNSSLDFPEDTFTASIEMDDYAAGQLGATNLYALLKSKIDTSDSAVRVGLIMQDAQEKEQVDRIKGFTEKLSQLAGYNSTEIQGYSTLNKSAEKTKLIIDIMQIDMSMTEETEQTVQTGSPEEMLIKNDLAGLCSVTESASERVVLANQNIQKLDSQNGVIAVCYGSGTELLNAVQSGILAGGVTANPARIGYLAVEMAARYITEQEVESIEVGYIFYDVHNMNTSEIKDWLYP